MEVEFVGGPADGRVEEFDGRLPPREVAVILSEQCHRYRRRVAAEDDGPLWVLVYAGRGEWAPPPD